MHISQPWFDPWYYIWSPEYRQSQEFASPVRRQTIKC